MHDTTAAPSASLYHKANADVSNLPDISQHGCKWEMVSVQDGKGDKAIDLGFIPVASLVNPVTFCNTVPNGVEILNYSATKQSFHQQQRGVGKELARERKSLGEIAHATWQRVLGNKVAPIILMLPGGATWQGTSESDYQNAVAKQLIASGVPAEVARTVSATYSLPF